MRSNQDGEVGEGGGGEEEGDVVVGGYAILTDQEEEEEEGVRDAARFAAEHLGDLDEGRRSSGLDAIEGSADVSVVVARGYSQVVAGTNYRLLVILAAPANATAANATAANANATNATAGCLGAFAVEVYVRWDGEKSIASWGRPVGCTEALELLNDPTQIDAGAFSSAFGLDDSSESQSASDQVSGQASTGSVTSTSGAGDPRCCVVMPLALATIGLAFIMQEHS
jgi:hypothetical protein